MNRTTHKQNDYQTYSRIMPVLWSGDFGVLHFIESVKHTARAGKRLAILIRYLKTQGISEINVIAHSLGNEVLLVAMQELGNQNQLLLNHVFLWEAAVPQDALSSTPCQHGYGDFGAFQEDKGHPPVTQEDVNSALWYDFPEAHTAARKITVLFSRNDNVLGPLLSEEECHQRQLNREAILQSKTWEESVPARLIIPLLGEESVFQFSVWSRTHVSLLISTSTQNEIYAMFQHAHASEPCRTTGDILKGTLDEEIIEIDRNLESISRALKYQKKGIPLHNKNGLPIHYPYPETAERLVASTPARQQAWRRTIADFNHWLADFSHQHPNFVLLPSFTSWIDKRFLYRVSDSEKNKSVPGQTQWATDPNQLSTPALRYLFLSHVLLNEFSYTFPPARGYAGVDKENNFIRDLIKQEKLLSVDQTLWLWSHSGMMVPSKDLMQHVYIDRIWLGDDNYHFGRYKKQKKN